MALGGGACKAKERIAPAPVTPAEEALVRGGCRKFLNDAANPYRTSGKSRPRNVHEYVFRAGMAAESDLKLKLGERYRDIENNPLRTAIEQAREGLDGEGIALAKTLVPMLVAIVTFVLYNMFRIEGPLLQMFQIKSILSSKKIRLAFGGATLVSIGLSVYFARRGLIDHSDTKVSYSPISTAICDGLITVRGSGK